MTKDELARAKLLAAEISGPTLRRVLEYVAELEAKLGKLDQNSPL